LATATTFGRVKRDRGVPQQGNQRLLEDRKKEFAMVRIGGSQGDRKLERRSDSEELQLLEVTVTDVDVAMEHPAGGRAGDSQVRHPELLRSIADSCRQVPALQKLPNPRSGVHRGFVTHLGAQHDAQRVERHEQVTGNIAQIARNRRTSYRVVDVSVGSDAGAVLKHAGAALGSDLMHDSLGRGARERLHMGTRIATMSHVIGLQKVNDIGRQSVMIHAIQAQILLSAFSGHATDLLVGDHRRPALRRMQTKTFTVSVCCPANGINQPGTQGESTYSREQTAVDSRFVLDLPEGFAIINVGMHGTFKLIIVRVHSSMPWLHVFKTAQPHTWIPCKSLPNQGGQI